MYICRADVVGSIIL